MADYGAILGGGKRRAKPNRKRNDAVDLPITAEEKKMDRISLNIEIQKKMLNGKEVTSMSVRKYGYPEGDFNSEYTDKDAFVKCVSSAVEQAVKAI